MTRKIIAATCKTYLWSPDTIISGILAITLCFMLPDRILGTFASSFYNIGITVLSIIFSLFFAALAIIMSSTDNDFIVYLEDENKTFTWLMSTFKFVLAILFISLAFSIFMYSNTEFFIKTHDDKVTQDKFALIIFQFLFTYSLIATASSINETIRFTTYRTRYLKSRNRNSDDSATTNTTTPTTPL